MRTVRNDGRHCLNGPPSTGAAGAPTRTGGLPGSLRAKTWLLVIPLLSFMMALLTALGWLLMMRSIHGLEKADRRPDVVAIMRAVDDALDRLVGTTTDWAGLDETCEFIQTGTPAYSPDVSDGGLFPPGSIVSSTCSNGRTAPQDPGDEPRPGSAEIARPPRRWHRPPGARCGS